MTPGAGDHSDRGLRARLWRGLGAPLMRRSPHFAYGFRRRLLRAFGMRLAGSVKVRRSVRIERPWLVSAGHLAIIGDDAWLVGSEPITIGERCVVSQLAMLVTAMVDPAAPVDAAAPRVRRGPVVVEDDAWVAADSVVLPGAIVREGAVIGARGTVETEAPAWRVCTGRPATPRGVRELRPVGAAEGAP